MDERERLLALLDRAHRRVEEATPHSPDWDAAMDALEDLERRIAENGLGRTRAEVLRAR